MNYKTLGKLAFNDKKNIDAELFSEISELAEENRIIEQKTAKIQKAVSDLRTYDRKELKKRKASLVSKDEIAFVEAQLKEVSRKRKAAKAVLRDSKKENLSSLEQKHNSNAEKLENLFEQYGRAVELNVEKWIGKEDFQQLNVALKEFKSDSKLIGQYQEQMEALLQQRNRIEEQINKLSEKIKSCQN